MNGDGTGAATVYDSATIEAEKNKLKFKEPYLLAAAANDEGRVGSQFIITLDQQPALNDSSHTIFGRLVSGKDTINQIEGIDDFKRIKSLVEMKIDQKEPKPLETTKIYIKNSGVYKFEQRAGEMRRRSAAGVYDFNP